MEHFWPLTFETLRRTQTQTNTKTHKTHTRRGPSLAMAVESDLVCVQGDSDSPSSWATGAGGVMRVPQTRGLDI